MRTPVKSLAVLAAATLGLISPVWTATAVESAERSQQALRVCPAVDPEDASVYAPLGNTAAGFAECSNGVPYAMDCPQGLLFNLRLNVCDWPRNAEKEGAETRLTAAAVTLSPTTELSAVVTWEDKPLYQAPVVFLDPQGSALCHAETDDTGRAACEADGVTEAGYTAVYAGTETLTAANATGTARS
ncbi:chitin binding peritrophin-A domain-containing protein [Streptomyces sp. NPDC057554]|uniref:chitin binding peritrophin-A domain-containing protein n=1 Tax=Streptomyces sp. NPDC057554 TaxID=3350538 RepID=UPI0036B4A823